MPGIFSAKMNLEERTSFDLSFYEGKTEAKPKDRMLLGASCCDESLENPGEESQIQATYFADEMQKSRASFEQSVLLDAGEARIEASMYENSFEVPPQNNSKLAGELNEIETSFQYFNTIQEIKANLAKLLSQQDIDEGDLHDLKLDTMNTLNCLNTGNYLLFL